MQWVGTCNGEDLVGGVILGEPGDAQRVWKQVRANRRQQTGALRLSGAARPSWPEIVNAPERILGRPWREMTAATATGAGTESWRWRRGIWGGVWPKPSAKLPTWATRRRKASAGSGSGRRPKRNWPSLSTDSKVNWQKDRPDWFPRVRSPRPPHFFILGRGRHLSAFEALTLSAENFAMAVHVALWVGAVGEIARRSLRSESSQPLGF